MNDQRFALNQARTAYLLSRRRLARLNATPGSTGRGAALQDCRRALDWLKVEAARTRGWLDGRRYERARRTAAVIGVDWGKPGSEKTALFSRQAIRPSAAMPANRNKRHAEKHGAVSRSPG